MVYHVTSDTRKPGFLTRCGGLGIASLLLTTLFLVLAPISEPSQAQVVTMAVIFVTNGADSGPGSLRQAILDAQPGDVIQFAPGLAGTTIGLTSGELVISTSLTIDGSTEPGIAVSGSNVSRVLRVASTAQTHLIGITITGGRGAAGAHGSAGAPGGGIFNSGVLTLTDVTIKANNAGSGGRGDDGGGPGGDGSRGGAGGAGGGIANLDTGTVEIQDTIFADNSAIGTGPDCQGTIRSNGHNLIRASSGCTILGATATDLIDVTGLLGPLQVNPPGTTATHALLFSSIAIDAGGCGAGSVTVDQRGVSRPRGSACDIGAYEFDPTAWWLRWFPEILRD